MRFLAPGWLVVAGVAAAAVFALHLLNRLQLRPRPFPTTRFVPEAPVRAVSSAWEPTDVALMLLRMSVTGLIGLALARPIGAPSHRNAVVLLVDRSPGADSAAMADHLGRLDAVPDTMIPFTALSAGLVQARRAGVHLARSADSVTLVILSPLATGLWDAATARLRRSWPGRITLVRTRERGNQGAAGVALDAPLDHPVRAALVRLGRGASGGPVRLRWPSSSPTADTATAVYAGGAAMVGRFPRLPMPTPSGAHAVAWFADGEPAAIELPLGSGCERIVGFAADDGDALLRASGLHIVERLISPCGAGWTPDRYQPADSADVAALSGTGPLASAEALPRNTTPPSLMPLMLALIALGAERVLRRRIA